MFSHHEQTSLQRCIEREASITHLKQTISLHRFASATQKLIHFVAVEEHVPEHPATPGHHFHLLSISTVFRFELVMFGLRAFQCSFLALGGFAGISWSLSALFCSKSDVVLVRSCIRESDRSQGCKWLVGHTSCLFSSHNFSGGLIVALHLGARLIGSCFLKRVRGHVS